MDARADPLQFFGSCVYWESANEKRIADITKANREKTREYNHHAGSKSYTKHAHDLVLQGKPDLESLVERTLTQAHHKYADMNKLEKNKQLLELCMQGEKGGGHGGDQHCGFNCFFLGMMLRGPRDC